MGKCRTKTTRQGGTQRTLSGKIKRRRPKTNIKLIKTVRKESSNRRRTTFLGSKHKCSQQTKPSQSSGGPTVSTIEAKPLKNHSLKSYKSSYMDSIASFTSMTVLGHGQRVIAGQGVNSVLLFPPDMKQYTSGFGYKTALGVTSYNGSECVAMIHDGYFDEKQYAFHFLEIRENKFEKTDHNIKPIRDHKPIAITSCNNKIYALVDTDPPSLKQFTKDRTEPVWSRQTGEDGQPLFRNPTCITSFYTTKGVSLVVADKIDDKFVNMKLLDGAKGRLIKSQKALGRNVVGMTTDRYDNLFVCYNSPKAISMLQSDLSHERFVYTSRTFFTNPSCLAYDKTNETLLMIDNGQTLHTLRLSYK